MNLRATTLGHASNEDFEVTQRGQNAGPQLIRDMRDSGENETAQLGPETDQELVKGILAQRFASVQIQGN